MVNWPSCTRSSSTCSTVAKLKGRTRCCGGVRTQAGRDVAQLLRLLRPQRHHGHRTAPHIDALLAGTRGSSFFTKLDLAISYHQLRVWQADRWKSSFRSQLGRFEWNVVPFGLQRASSLLMRVMNQALTVELDFPGGPSSAPSYRTPRHDLASHHGGVPGASGPLGRCALVYMDDCLVHSGSGTGV